MNGADEVSNSVEVSCSEEVTYLELDSTSDEDWASVVDLIYVNLQFLNIDFFFPYSYFKNSIIFGSISHCILVELWNSEEDCASDED